MAATKTNGRVARGRNLSDVLDQADQDLDLPVAPTRKKAGRPKKNAGIPAVEVAEGLRIDADLSPAAKKKAAKEAEGPGTQIYVPPIRIGQVMVEVIGDTNLLVHRFTEKAKTMIEEKQAQAAKKPRERRNPEEEYLASCYMIRGKPKEKSAIHGIPAAGFKKGMVRAAGLIGATAMTTAERMFQIIGHPLDISLAELKFDEMRMHTATVRIGTMKKVADMRYRAEYTGWRAYFTVSYNASLMGIDEVLNLLNWSGAFVGWGEWRPERGGMYGKFIVGEVKALPVREHGVKYTVAED